jgi:hypothetical protein
MRIAAQQRRARPAEPLQMDLMANPIARPRMIYAALGGYRLQVQMVVMVLRPETRHIVIDITHRQIGPHPARPHRLIQQKRRRPRRILRQSLVDPNPDLLTLGELALNNVPAQYLIDQRLSQLQFSLQSLRQLLKKIIKEIFFNNIGLTCNFAELNPAVQSNTYLRQKQTPGSDIARFPPGLGNK